MASKNKQKSSDTDGEENNIIVKSLDKQDNTLQRTRKDNNVLPKIPSLVTITFFLFGSQSWILS